MTGCFVAWKCLVACLFLDESQQPTCPQFRHSRRCTQVSPISRHSLQPVPDAFTGFRLSKCLHSIVHLKWSNRVRLGNHFTLQQTYRNRFGSFTYAGQIVCFASPIGPQKLIGALHKLAAFAEAVVGDARSIVSRRNNPPLSKENAVPAGAGRQIERLAIDGHIQIEGLTYILRLHHMQRQRIIFGIWLLIRSRCTLRKAQHHNHENEPYSPHRYTSTPETLL